MINARKVKLADDTHSQFRDCGRNKHIKTQQSLIALAVTAILLGPQNPSLIVSFV